MTIKPKDLKPGNCYEVTRDINNCFKRNQRFYFIRKERSNFVGIDIDIWLVLTDQKITKYFFEETWHRFKLLN